MVAVLQYPKMRIGMLLVLGGRVMFGVSRVGTALVAQYWCLRHAAVAVPVGNHASSGDFTLQLGGASRYPTSSH